MTILGTFCKHCIGAVNFNPPRDRYYYHIFGGNASVKKPSVQPMRRNCCLIGTSLSSSPREEEDVGGDSDCGSEDDFWHV